MEKLLSILIPTIPLRLDGYGGLLRDLEKQRADFNLTDKVQILSLLDTKEMSVGEKRNWLMKLSIGQYIQFADDDDRVAPNYLAKMVEGCSYGRDVVTFCGEYWENNLFHSDFDISTFVKVAINQPRMMYRRPNHICAVLRGIALNCPFPHINSNEDSDYTEQINKIIKSEYHINDKLYFYMFDRSKSQTQNN